MDKIWNKKAGNPTPRPKLVILIFRGRGNPMVVDIGGVLDSAWVATGRLYQAVRYLLLFCLNFEFKFWVPQFGVAGAPMGVGLSDVRWSVIDFL